MSPYHAYLQAGLSLIPCSPTTKNPLLHAWKPYQTRQPTAEEVTRWFQRQESAVAIITGQVSGGLTVLDFDAPPLFVPWVQRVSATQPNLLAGLPLVQTPSGGFHVYFRSAALRGNQKLAVDPARPGGKYTLIETRGEGGYVLAPPSPGYTLLEGDLTQIPTLTPDQRTCLLDAARYFTRAAPEPERPHLRPRPRGDGSRPGDDFNRRGDVTPVLERHGWRRVGQHGITSYWRRPGKRRGHSATYNHCDHRYFYVFTTNAPPFAPERGYSNFSVFALLEHGGDFAAAAQRLQRLGFGTT